MIAKIASDVARQLQSPEMQERLAALGVDAVGSSPAEFQALFAAEVSRWAKVVRGAGVVLD